MHLFQRNDHALSEAHLRTDAGLQSTAHSMRFIEIPRVDYEKLRDDRLREPSANVQARVEAVRERQRQRFASGQKSKSANGIACNADMRPAQIRQYCQLDEARNSLMRSAMHQMQPSARAYHRVLKLARANVDLAGEEKIAPTHLAEAL